MAKSMTGFGRSIICKNGHEYSVEVKSVNHRYKDINIRLPRELNLLEEKVHSLIKDRFTRGRFDLTITFRNLSKSEKDIHIDKDLARQYVKLTQELRNDLNIKGSISLDTLIKLPDVLTVEDREVNIERHWKDLEDALKEALNSLDTMREKEGKILEKDILKRVSEIKDHVRKIKKRRSTAKKDLRNKLRSRIESLIARNMVEEARLNQEVVFYAERSDITEEILRLESHLKQFITTIRKEKSPGRKMDFLLQEINREINTVASKSNDAEISTLAVAIKSETEKIREQTQNLE